jgi:hypothetical protein
MTTPLMSVSSGWINPPEPDASGTCQHPKCGAELYDVAYEVTLTSELVNDPTTGRLKLNSTTALWCVECTREYLIDAVKAAPETGLDDLPYVEMRKPCRDCSHLPCWCPG